MVSNGKQTTVKGSHTWYWDDPIHQYNLLCVSFLKLTSCQNPTHMVVVRWSNRWQRPHSTQPLESVSASTRTAMKPMAISGSGLYFTGWLFVNVPPYFHYQNEKRVAANQSYFFKTFSMLKSSSLAEHVFFLFTFVLKMGRNDRKVFQIKNPPGCSWYIYSIEYIYSLIKVDFRSLKHLLYVLFVTNYSIFIQAQLSWGQLHSILHYQWPIK